MEKIEGIDVNRVAIELMRKNQGKLIPTFNRDTSTAFFQATGGTNLSKVLYALAEDDVIVKDFIRYAPEGKDPDKPRKFTKNENGTVTMYVDGLEVIRKLGKDGKVSEAIFYLKGDDPATGKPYIPEWVNRRMERSKKVNYMIDEIRQFTEGIADAIKTAPEPVPDFVEEEGAL